MVNLGNVMTAMVTPFKNDLSVDYEMAARLANYLADNGSDTIVVHGTTGESPTLSHDEEFELYRVVKKAVGGRVKVVAGTGSNSTSTTISASQEAEKIGVDGLLVVVPYYNKPSQEGMYQHFKAVAQKTKLPIIIYNIPGRCVVNMLPETIARVAKECPNVIGLKDSAANIEQTKMTAGLVPSGFTIWSGDDSMALPMMRVGAVGVISVASHVAGKEIAAMVAAFHAGEVKKAEAIHERLLPLFNVLFITANPTPVKAALAMIGLPVGIPRLPLIEANESEKERIKKVLQDLKFV
ncbi:MAG: 4-hydroxy-tetrahydrodipicolinate synthase [Candidatus Margulisbacteria bacterium]|nr:4-hydroxy-tetrahydrodipicolinate synthase [Candidatus Margulisiibacteriota bacterium]MBU1616151.1 4-hydroxy-tetrahydrodipicolinate synthase [Candidatus Margulisiibacteriota bacterium]